MFVARKLVAIKRLALNCKPLQLDMALGCVRAGFGNINLTRLGLSCSDPGPTKALAQTRLSLDLDQPR